MQHVTKVQDINSDDENSELGYKDETESVQENSRVITEHKAKKEVESNTQNQNTLNSDSDIPHC